MPQDTTDLTPAEEARFQKWVKANGIRDLDHPDSHYDYRGYWQETGGAPHPRTKLARSHGTPTPDEQAQVGERTHYPDTYKQHGHPTFSVESKYSRGLQDGGRWLPGDSEKAYVKPPLPSHEVDAEGRYRKLEPPKKQPVTPLSDADVRRNVKRGQMRTALKNAGLNRLEDVEVSGSPVAFPGRGLKGIIDAAQEETLVGTALKQGIRAAGRYVQENVARGLNKRVEDARKDTGELKPLKRVLPHYEPEESDDAGELKPMKKKLPYYDEMGVAVATAARKQPVSAVGNGGR